MTYKADYKKSMASVKSKKRRRLVAVQLTEKELSAIEGQKRPEESLSEFIRAAIRFFASERAAREFG